MAQNKKIRVLRTSQDGYKKWELFEIPRSYGHTVLEALTYVYEKVDPTLAFRQGCRSGKCGLCGVNASGLARLACMTKLRDGMEIGPLPHLPILRDLVVNRDFLLEWSKRLRLFPCPPEIGRGKGRRAKEERLSEDFIHLARCTECLCCLSSCANYDYREKHFGGPYLFLKLAQLRSHPQDTMGRASQALSLGIERCLDCRSCFCPKGIPIYRSAIAPLLKEGGSL